MGMRDHPRWRAKGSSLKRMNRSLRNCSENKETFPERQFWEIRGQFPEEKHKGAKRAIKKKQFWGIRE